MVSRIKIILQLLLIILLSLGPGYAQLPDYHVRLFDQRFGIRTDMGRVIKDQRNFIWLSSADHIYRFDGTGVKEFSTSDRINSMLCDRHGDIWMNSPYAIFRFKNDHLGFVATSMDTTGRLRIGKIFQLPGKDVWAQTNQGFYEWNMEKQQFQKLDFSVFNIPAQLSTASFSSYGNTIFFLSNDSLFAFNVEDKTHLTLPRINDQGGINAISDADLLVTSRGITTSWCDFKSGTITPIDFPSSIPGRNNDFLFVQDVLPLDDDNVLVASHEGLLELNKTSHKFKQLRLYHNGNPLEPNPNFYNLFLDNDRKIWLIMGNGLISFYPNKETIGLIRNHEASGELTWPNNVRDFAEDDSGNFWISTSEGFGYWNLEKNKITMYPAVPHAADRLNAPSVRGLLFDGHYLIMGTASVGIWMYDPATKKFRKPAYDPSPNGEHVREKLEQEFIKQIIRLPDGNYFVVGRDCYIMNKESYVVKEFDISHITSKQANVCYLGKDHNVWLGTEEGLISFDSTLHYLHDWKFNLTVNSLHEFDDGQWLLGTTKGLFTINLASDSIHPVRDANLSDKSSIAFIIADRQGIFWIGSNDGLTRYDPGTKKIDKYDYADNIQGNLFSTHPFLSREGILFLGGNNGINYFHPEKIVPAEDSLVISLMKVTVNQNDTGYYDRSAPLSLKYSQNSVEIEFMAPYYGNSNRLQYRYQLIGLAPDWKNNGVNNKVRFNSLAPGNYEFHVEASVNGVHWYESDQSMKFDIAYPFWQTWWFIICCIIVVSGLIYYYVRRRIMVIREKEKTKRDYERKIAEVEMHALRAQMNPHFMFNSLNSINNFILKNDPDNASGYLTKFSRLMRLILDNSRNEWVLLENELKALELYIEMEVVRFDHVFEYEIIVSPEINVSTTSIPPMIIQPYVENAIWHGLLHRKKPGGKLMIKLWHEQDRLHISIEDNGVGREEAARQKSKSATKHKSHGMKITAERIEIVNRIYNVNATVKIDDLPGQNGTIGGTKVSLTLKDRMYDSYHRG